MSSIETRVTLAQFVIEHGISMTCEYRDSNPNMADMGRDARHFTCTLRNGRKRLSIPFSQGSAFTEEPTAEDVLNCLALDAAGLENSPNFDDWASEYGYDADSRRAEKTFKTVERQAAKLMAFLGADAYDRLVWHTESL